MSLKGSEANDGERLSSLVTEADDPRLANIDTMSTHERLKVINEQDLLVAEAVGLELPSIAEATQLIVRSFQAGGRLIYVGAGTSGRLGVLDASECPPTFGTAASLVVGVIAGGPAAMFEAVEGAEDDFDAGVEAMAQVKVASVDTVVGISASGRAPFVAGSLTYARRVGASTVAVVNNVSSLMSSIADITIAPIVGPEVIAGSTRMKAGSAQKMVLNMLSTNAMIEIGKTYGNLMVDVKATNAKLRTRAVRITTLVAHVDEKSAALALDKCGGSAKTAILMLRTGLNAEEAATLLNECGGFLRKALETYQTRSSTFAGE